MPHNPIRPARLAPLVPGVRQVTGPFKSSAFTGQHATIVADNLPCLARWLDGIDLSQDRAAYADAHNSDPWAGRRSWDETKAMLATGDMKHVEAARALQGKVRHLLDWSARTHETRSGPIGSVLNMGGYLAGTPDMLRYRKRVEKQQAPLTVVMGINSAGMVATSELLARGVAVLALVELLSAKRPVTLWATAWSPARTRDHGPVMAGFAVKLPTQPVSIAHVAAALASPEMSRRVSFVGRRMAAQGLACSAFPPIGTTPKQVKGTGAKLAVAALGIGKQDILYIPRADGTDSIAADPAAWLGAQLALYGRPDA